MGLDIPPMPAMTCKNCLEGIELTLLFYPGTRRDVWYFIHSASLRSPCANGQGMAEPVDFIVNGEEPGE